MRLTVEILTIDIESGDFSLPIPEGKIGSAYLQEGTAAFNGQPVNISDFVLIEGQEQLDITAANNARIFIILSPANLDYKTYAQLRF